jgi:hypothetical protein
MPGRVVAHPFLFAVFPILYLFSENLESALPLGVLTRPVLLALALSALMLGFLWLVFRSAQRAAVLASVLILLFYSYGHVLRALSRDRAALLLGVWTVIATGSMVLVARAPRRLPRLTAGMNLAALVLVVMNLVPIVASGLGGRERSAAGSPSEHSIPVDPQKPVERPDIYYLVFDRYADEESLSETFGFDNRPFLSWLSDKGFFVAKDSTANYPRTAQSLASSLNLSYLDFLPTEGEQAKSYGAIYDLLGDFEAARFLKDNGYRYLHMGSWFGPTKTDPSADVNYDFKSLSEFENILYRTTLLSELDQDGSLLRKLNPRQTEWARRRWQFEHLIEIADDPGPNFVFAHILVPHPPYVTDADGGFVEVEEERTRPLKQLYVDQLVYTNRQIQKVVNGLLSASPEDPPVIVLQADEGPQPNEFLNIKPTRVFDWTEASRETLLFKFRLFNAYYLPGGADRVLYPSITPVNTFRVIFDRYLGADLELLPDKNYVQRDRLHPYEFHDVTRKLAGQAPFRVPERGDE